MATRDIAGKCGRLYGKLRSPLAPSGVVRLRIVQASVQISEQAVHPAGIGGVDDVSAAPSLRKQASAHQLLEMEGERSGSDPEACSNDARGQPLRATTREQAHELQPNVLCQCTQRSHGGFTLHRQSAIAGPWNPYRPLPYSARARDWAIRNGD